MISPLDTDISLDNVQDSFSVYRQSRILIPATHKQSEHVQIAPIAFQVQGRLAS